MTNRNVGARILAGVASHAVDQLAELAQASIRQAAQGPGRASPTGERPPPGGQPPAAAPNRRESPRLQLGPPGELPRRSPAQARRHDLPPQGPAPSAQHGPAPAAAEHASSGGGDAGHAVPAASHSDPTVGAAAHSVQGGIAAGHEIAAMMAELSQAAALDSATKKSADQVKTAAQ
jgi:hypothetical protein